MRSVLNASRVCSSSDQENSVNSYLVTDFLNVNLRSHLLRRQIFPVRKMEGKSSFAKLRQVVSFSAALIIRTVPSLHGSWRILKELQKLKHLRKKLLK